jgi:hypothetical protein
VGLFGRRKPRQAERSMDRTADKSDRKHLEEFVSTNEGVEAFIEPKTTVTETTIVLVARSGQWTRRRVPDEATAFSWARKLGIPCYDAKLVGYPQRMRDWDARKAAERRKLLDP